MKDKPLVSIIIPFYNRGYLLPEVLKKLTNQTYNYFEVIIVDDGSTEPLRINDNFGLNVVIKRLHKNMGPGYARKEGRLLAKGKYIAYLDSDDWWSDNFIEECVTSLEANPSKGMVYANTVILKKGQELNRRVKDLKPVVIIPTIFIYDKRFWSTASCMWRSNVSLAEHWKPFRNYEDYLHDLCCSRINNKVIFIEKAFTYKNQSATNRIKRDGREVEKTLDHIVKLNLSPSYDGICFFTIKCLYEFKITVKNIKFYIILPMKEFKLKFHKYFLYYFLFLFISVFSLRSYKVKNYIKYLK